MLSKLGDEAQVIPIKEGLSHPEEESDKTRGLGLFLETREGIDEDI